MNDRNQIDNPPRPITMQERQPIIAQQGGTMEGSKTALRFTGLKVTPIFLLNVEKNWIAVDAS